MNEVTMSGIPQINKVITKHIKDYNKYLDINLSYSCDFLGNNWISKQNNYVFTKQFDKICCLYKILFKGGFYYEKIYSQNQYNFLYGLNKILSLILDKYKSFYSNNYNNHRFFISPNESDFEGIWSELILLDYINDLGYDVCPYKDQSDRDRKTPDFYIVGQNIDFEVKCCTNSNSSPLSIYAGFKPTISEQKNILQRFQKSVAKSFPNRTLFAIIDISLYHELFSEVIGSIIFDNNQLSSDFQKHLKLLKQNNKNISHLYFQLRAPSTRLLSQLFKIN